MSRTIHWSPPTSSETHAPPFYELAADDPVIGPLVQRFRGLRPPRFPTVFEGLVNAIACQQVALDLGIIVLNRLSQRFGPHLVDHDGVRHAFPAAADLADVGEETIRELGFSRQKARAIQQLAAHVADTSVDLERLEGLNNDQAVAALSRPGRAAPPRDKHDQIRYEVFGSEQWHRTPKRATAQLATTV